jgi:hypothetical protein
MKRNLVLGFCSDPRQSAKSAFIRVPFTRANSQSPALQINPPYAVMPPSTTSVWPVMYAPESLDR